MAAVLELLLADSRTPSGGYAHSGGLEAAVADGLAVDRVPAFVRARLRTVASVEASIAAAACRVDVVDALLDLDRELAARTPAQPLRQASRRLGQGLLRTARSWWPHDRLLADYAAASELSPRPVVLGAIAQAGAVTPLATARLSLYEDAATVVSAAVKLLPLDAARASGWLAALAGEIEALAVSSANAAPNDLPSTSTPLLDARAMAHSEQTRRLFVS